MHPPLGMAMAMAWLWMKLETPDRSLYLVIMFLFSLGDKVATSWRQLFAVEIGRSTPVIPACIKIEGQTDQHSP